MANSTADIQLDGVGYADGRRFHLPVSTGASIYDGVMVSQLTADGKLVAATTALSGPVIGKATHAVLAATAGQRCLIETDRIYLLANGTGANAFSEASAIGAPAYAFDDHTVYDNSNAGALKLAGSFRGMEANGKVRVLITPEYAINAADDAGEVTGPPTVQVRGRSTADIANLAAFTVAGVDGLTYVAGERIFLNDQTAPAENGPYLVGTVAAGVAPLTRVLDADGATEIVSGMVIVVSEGTAHLDTAWKLDTNAPITIGTTALTFTQVPFGFGAAAALADVTKAAENAGTSNLAARIDHKHDVSTAAAIDIGEAASGEGAATSLARSNHIHKAIPTTARYVMTTNVANLAAFTVAQDGVTGVEGNVVLLANQTTGAESGLYSIGTVGGGTAPLTRVAWLPTGAIVQSGYTIHVGEGTLNAASNWFISTAGAITIGTTAHLWFPESIVQSLAFPVNTGLIAVTNVPILSTTKTMLNVINIAEVTADLTVRYSREPGTVVAGAVGTASITVMAEIAAGGVNVDDDSTLLVQIQNR